jgi:hypothetical protein
VTIQIYPSNLTSRAVESSKRGRRRQQILSLTSAYDAMYKDNRHEEKNDNNNNNNNNKEEVENKNVARGFMPSQAPQVRGRKRASLIILLRCPRCGDPCPSVTCGSFGTPQRYYSGYIVPRAKDRRLNAFSDPLTIDEMGQARLRMLRTQN